MMPKLIRSKSGSSKTARRRDELRRTLPRRTFDLRAMVQQRGFVSTTLITLAFLAVTSILVIWAREQIMVHPSQVMTQTRVNRLDYRVANIELTDAKRQEARDSAPHVYALNSSYLDRLAAALNGLPKAVAGKSAIEDISPELREEFQLSDAGLAELAPFAVEGETTPQWRAWVENLVQRQLPANPLIASDEYQTYWVAREYSTTLKRLLHGASNSPKEIPRNADAIELRPEMALQEESRLGQLVLAAGFPAQLGPFIAAKLAFDAKPTISIDAEATAALARRAAEEVEISYDEHGKGDVIYHRGDTLSHKQFKELQTEADAFAATAPAAQRWLPRLGIIGLMTVLATFLVGYIVLFYSKIARNPLRLLAICALLGGMLALTCTVGVRAPSLIYLGAAAPTVMVAIVALLAYDQRIALFLSATQCALATMALEQSIAMYLVLFAGCGIVVAQLREMRHRNSLIQASAVTGVVLAGGAILLGLIETPLVPGAWRQIIFYAFLAGFGGFAVGFLILGLLPSFERFFDITTGMTLAELRDPKQPLLKQLQQKAPGTYNHSLQVANIAEAAAEAVGANGLLVYVGALYHDIGKLNKPDYFIENKTDGASKHDKLSPAMSLLVIVGHVKDGIELAREYGLPRLLQHFIESHHGTTLVEYFYHAAKTQAENDDRSTVEEIEFRYPGPKPRTKEAAILMLADTVESATRSLAEPNPARIESLVRQLSRKRLADGQYDHCDLTFRELGLIEESVVKSVCAIYHGRISYPSTKPSETAQTLSAKPVSA
ncbi:MAG: HDIG domain-containing protein [Planctomycetota bacterium]|nr:HDIG domain-containing protein [Planctomycetota bacterium]